MIFKCHSILYCFCVHALLGHRQQSQGTGDHETDLANNTTSDNISNPNKDSCLNPTPVLTSLGSQSNMDIACSIQEDPVHPVNHQFPSSLIGNRECSFNPKWYDKYQWLEYSISKDATFCYPCCFFVHGTSKAEDTFVSIGYCDWKHGTGKDGALVKYDTSLKHKEALMNWCEYEAHLKSGTSVTSSLDNARKE